MHAYRHVDRLSARVFHSDLHGAQIGEGLNLDDVLDQYFHGSSTGAAGQEIYHGAEDLMARHREVHDRILALLALHPYPLGVDEIARHLDVSRWQTDQSLAALHVCGIVIRTLAESGGGRPRYLWALLNVKPVAPELLALMRLFPIDTVVVTPSNREARIVSIDNEGRATLAYLDGDPDGPPMKLTLLKAFQPGRDRPQPVRIKD